LACAAESTLLMHFKNALVIFQLAQTFLKQEGLSQLKSNLCIFKNANSLLIAIYVDDLIIMGKDERQIEENLLKLENQFQIIKTTNPKFYLRIEIERTRWDTYFSNQI
jgi:hypothetical protein